MGDTMADVYVGGSHYGSSVFGVILRQSCHTMAEVCMRVILWQRCVCVILWQRCVYVCVSHTMAEVCMSYYGRDVYGEPYYGRGVCVWVIP